MNLHICVVNEANLLHSLFLVYLLFYLFFIPHCIPDSQEHMLLHTRQAAAYAPAYQRVRSISSCIPESQEHMLLHTRESGAYAPAYQTVRSICSCIPDSHPNRITSTKCRINTVVSPCDGPIVA
jgi:hypothetical protein